MGLSGLVHGLFIGHYPNQVEEIRTIELIAVTRSVSQLVNLRCWRTDRPQAAGIIRMPADAHGWVRFPGFATIDIRDTLCCTAA